MTISVNPESIPLAPESQMRIEELLKKLKIHLSEGAALRMFIKPLGRDTFKILLRVHDHQHDFVYETTGSSILHLTREAVTHIRRRLIESKEKFVSGRRNKETHRPTG